MKKILVLDQHNYTESMPVDVRYCVRGIVEKNGKIAVQRGAAGDHKIIGGGMEAQEDHFEALYREVLEEAGFFVIRESMRPLGEIVEKRRDLYDSSRVYECHTLFYACDIEEKTVEPRLTLSEIRKGYQLIFASVPEIVEANKCFLHQPWIARDTHFLEMYAAGSLEQKTE